MRDHGWVPKEILQNAKTELLASDLIEKTRQCGLYQCDLFGFTWIGIHECGGKLDVPATPVGSNLWRKVKPPEA